MNNNILVSVDQNSTKY